MSSTEITGVTAAIDKYETATAGIPDCFDGIGTAEFAEFAALAQLLDKWWEAIDNLDADVAPPRK